MANLTSIQVTVSTMDEEHAGVDGPVYLGICGREFSIDSSKNDFERGAGFTYRFGEGANVQRSDLNDPREPQLQNEAADRFPVYIRLEHPTDHWKVQRVTVSLNDELFPMWETIGHISARQGIWLGRRAGRVLYLSKHQD